ncbi:hypothetical protein Ga0609869_000354 [Rhodovulum iodosum]|uniref:Uncharacterized protein n=1 Tax=Rhodovulum iodosum TaxID=68291 RepID=A0ABV3XNW0_9RHOB|nr:DUF6524 family protein [Rhodovulum robiginosum]RSK37942.1 hypothetical protein EJA01_03185 [Rhodovulum robiginosum]
MSGFLLRTVIAFILLAATYNPTKFNYVTWAQDNYATQKPLVIGLGIILGIALLYFLLSTIRTLGSVGIFLLLVIVALLGYILVDKGVIALELSTNNIWGVIAILSLILGGASSWRGPSKIKSRSKVRPPAGEEARA